MTQVLGPHDTKTSQFLQEMDDKLFYCVFILFLLPVSVPFIITSFYHNHSTRSGLRFGVFINLIESLWFVFFLVWVEFNPLLPNSKQFG